MHYILLIQLLLGCFGNLKSSQCYIKNASSVFVLEVTNNRELDSMYLVRIFSDTLERKEIHYRQLGIIDVLSDTELIVQYSVKDCSIFGVYNWNRNVVTSKISEVNYSIYSVCFKNKSLYILYDKRVGYNENDASYIFVKEINIYSGFNNEYCILKNKKLCQSYYNNLIGSEFKMLMDSIQMQNYYSLYDLKKDKVISKKVSSKYKINDMQLMKVQNSSISKVLILDGDGMIENNFVFTYDMRNKKIDSIHIDTKSRNVRSLTISKENIWYISGNKIYESLVNQNYTKELFESKSGYSPEELFIHFTH